MPFTEQEFASIKKQIDEPNLQKLYFDMANIYLDKIGDSKKAKVLEFFENNAWLANMGARDVIRQIGIYVNEEFGLFKIPDKVWRLLPEAPDFAMAPTHVGLKSAPSLPEELKTKYVFEESEEELLLKNGYERVGRRGTTDNFLAVIKAKGFASLEEAGCGINGKVRGDGVYIGLGASKQDALNWCKEGPQAKFAVVLKIYARMKFAKGRVKPMAAYYEGKGKQKYTDEERIDYIGRLDGKYDYVQGDIQGKGSLTEIKFSREAAKDLRVIVEYLGVFSGYKPC